MSYQGITLAVGLIVGVGTLLYHLYKNSQQQYYQERPYDGEVPDQPPPPGTRPRKRTNAKKVVCSICLDLIPQFSPRTVVLRCEHIFHKECLTNWCTHNRTCPNCRAIININECFGN